LISTRKLNQVRNSFYVYLPRQWCDSFGLTKNSEVRIEQFPDGYLRITPPSIGITENRPLIFKITPDNQANIVELLIGSYIVGTGQLRLDFSEDLDIGMREMISTWIRKLPGFEILEEQTNSLTISDTSEKQVLTPILRRQFSTTKYMLSSLVKAMETEDYEHGNKILDRDEDVNRHRYFVERLCHLALQNPSYARKIEIEPSDALHYSLAAKYVERIADHVCEATKALLELGTVSKKIVDYSKRVLEVFDLTTRTFFGISVGDDKSTRGMPFSADEAFGAIRRTEAVEHRISRISAASRNAQEALLNLHLGRIVSYCADIGEVAINRTIEEHIR
jgi:phosphate uptake regulator